LQTPTASARERISLNTPYFRPGRSSAREELSRGQWKKTGRRLSLKQQLFTI
jgi:hypothetical protein